MAQNKEIDPMGLLGVLKEYIQEGLDDRAAFNKFRSEYAMNVLGDGNAQQRQERFTQLLNHYRRYPAQHVFDIRKEKTTLFKRDLMEAFLSTPDIPEMEVEDWLKQAQSIQQWEKGIVESLTMLAEKRPEDAATLTERAKELWPDWYQPEAAE